METINCKTNRNHVFYLNLYILFTFYSITGTDGADGNEDLYNADVGDHFAKIKRSVNAQDLKKQKNNLLDRFQLSQQTYLLKLLLS